MSIIINLLNDLNQKLEILTQENIKLNKKVDELHQKLIGVEKVNKNYISEEELNNTSLTKSKILRCCIKNITGECISNAKKFPFILYELNKGGLKCAIKNENNYMREIIRICKILNYSLVISIELPDGKIIHFKHLNWLSKTTLEFI